MFRPNDFHVDTGWDEAGLLVTVSHLLTKQQRSARPKNGESAFKVQTRLQAELVRTFLDLKDFCFEMGRCEVDGKIGGFYRVEHLPSKRTMSVDTITSPHVKSSHQVLELLLDDLWRDGLLGAKSDG
jgi:hypothetical protein